MKTKQLLKYQSLALVTGLALFATLWAIPGTAHAQSDLFASVNSNPYSNGGSNIYQYDPAGSYTTFLPNLDHPRGLAFDSAGNLFVTTFTWAFDSNGDPVGVQTEAILKVSGGVASTFATGFNGALEGLVTDSTGNLFVASGNFPDEIASTIYKITPDGTLSTFGSVPGQCFGLAFDSSGTLFAAGSNETLTCGAIYKLPSPNVRSVFVGDQSFCSVPGPIGLTFDAFDILFVSTSDDNGNGDIRKFGADGTEITPPFATGLTKSPRGLAFDSDGNLFVAEPGFGCCAVGDILKFTPLGAQTVFASQVFGTRGNRGPEFLAFAPGAVAPPSTAVVLTFPDATAPVTTTVTPVDPNSVPPPPSGFGTINLALDITTTATPTGPIIIAFTVPSALDVSTLRVLHYDNGTWVDSTIYRTDPNYPSNPAPNTVYASVNSLSPFMVATFKYAAQIQQPINADGTSVFNAKRGVIPVTFKLTSDGVATCQLPPATISVFRTSGGAVGSIDESTYLLKSDSGSNFRIDSTKCQYSYNLGASSFGPGTYQVFISIGGSVAGSATFALK